MYTALGLYIHFPFCVRKCSYCDFLSAPGGDAMKSAYTDALVREIRTWKKVPTVPVDTVFLGGGTPSVMDPEDLQRVMDAVRDSFTILPDAEITMEMNPGVYEDRLFSFLSRNVNRVSCGLQSVHSNELKKLGRIHSFEDFKVCYQKLRDAGIRNINVDLMFALPGQTGAGWTETLSTVARMGPEHISAYSLIIEEGTPFYDLAERGLLDLPDEDCEREMYASVGETLARFGYSRYEISNYAKPGFACSHNVRYWKRKDYLGLGLGAASMMRAASMRSAGDQDPFTRQGTARTESKFHEILSGPVGEFRWNCTDDIQVYIKEAGRQTPVYAKACVLAEDAFADANLSDKTTRNFTRLSMKDAMEEFMFLGLRMTEGVTDQDFRQSFGLEIMDVYGETVKDLTKKGLLAVETENGRTRIALTSRGTDLSNTVLSEFLLDS